MGMVLNLIRVSKEDLDSFLNNSDLLEERVYNEENFDAEWYFDLDKAWDGVQYLLSKKSGVHLKPPLTPIDRVMFTFKYIDEEQDLGYGPGQYLTPEEVKETSAALSSISIDDFSKRYNGEDMERIGIYPGGWTDPQLKDYVVDSLKNLIEFYSIAANSNQAVISVMN